MDELPWRVLVAGPAAKYLDRLSIEDRERIRTALLELTAGPHHVAKRLHGRPEWSLRIGGWRALLDVDASARTVTVATIGPRGDGDRGS